MRRLLLATTILGLSAVASPDARAQTGTPPNASTATNSGSLQEVVVTAERRKSTVQKTAASISVRSGDEMNKQGRYSLADYLQDIPGVSGTPATNNPYDPYANVVIRGVVPSNGASGTNPPTTAVYVDGIYQGLGNNYDVDRVEVLRGPQGTLYGRSATGGVIAAYTKDPVLGKFGVDLTASYGSYDFRNLQLAVNLPITPELALRASGLESDQLGYLNLHDGSQEQTDGRLKLLYKPNADLSVLIGVATQEDHRHNGGPVYAETAPGVLTPSSPSPVSAIEDHGHQFWGNANWDFGPATLTYLPSFRRMYYQPAGSYFAIPGIGTIAYNPMQTLMDQTITQELRVASNGTAPLSWIGGVFYYNNIYKNSSYLQWFHSGAIAFDNNLRRRTQDVGVFGQGTYAFDSATRLTGGVRYDLTPVTTTALDENNETRGALGSPTQGLPEDFSILGVDAAQGSSNFSNVTYNVRLERDLTPANMVYALASSGFLPGDVQVASHNDGSLYSRRFSEETLHAFEAGSKNRFLDNRLQINGSVYYYLYQGYQADAQPEPTVPGAAHITVTAPATMYGIDLEAIYRLTPDDTLHVTFGAINAQFTANPVTYDSYDGLVGAFHTFIYQKFITGIAPETVTAAYDHTFNFEDGSSVDAHADMQYFAGYYSAPLNLLSIPATIGTSFAANLAATWIPAQTLGNLALTWTSANGKYSIGGYIRNVGNDVYIANQTLVNNVYEATPTIGRTYGLNLHVSY